MQCCEQASSESATWTPPLSANSSLFSSVQVPRPMKEKRLSLKRIACVGSCVGEAVGEVGEDDGLEVGEVDGIGGVYL